MKRKQFHLTVAEEKVLYEISKKHNISEAEVVRMAIREYGKQLAAENPLVQMAKTAQTASPKVFSAPTDLSENHDRYLSENTQGEKIHDEDEY